VLVLVGGGTQTQIRREIPHTPRTTYSSFWGRRDLKKGTRNFSENLVIKILRGIKPKPKERKTGENGRKKGRPVTTKLGYCRDLQDYGLSQSRPGAGNRPGKRELWRAVGGRAGR